MSLMELFEEATAEQSREHAHRQKEARLAGDPARAVGAARRELPCMRMVTSAPEAPVCRTGSTVCAPDALRVGGDGAAQRLRATSNRS